MTTPDLADRAAYFPDADALVCADIHLGRDADSNVELPMGEDRRIPERIEALLAAFEPSSLVVAGDVLHSFDRVPDGVAESLAAIETTAADADAELVLVAGNHDGMLESVATGPVADTHDLGTGTVVVHGDETPPTFEADRYVVGHDHPAIVIEGMRQPCYLEGPAPEGGASVFVLPAFNKLARGTVLNGAKNGDPSSPLLAEIERFRPAVRDVEAEETLWFPPFTELRRLL